MKEVFNTFWHGTEICPITALCLSSFVYHGHQVNLYTYDLGIKVNNNINILDARDVLPIERLYEAHGGFESFSDVFRYKLLLEKGGWWVDTDVICNSSSIPQVEIAFAREGSGEKIANGQIKFPAGHPVLQEAVRYVENYPDTGWGTTGPILLTRLLSEAGLENQRWSTQDFYPIFWAESAKFLIPSYKNEILHRTGNSLFTHIYTSRFRRRLNFDQRRFLPPEKSFLDLMYLTYGVGNLSTNLTSVDEKSLMDAISQHMNEDWIQKHLQDENLQFIMPRTLSIR